MKWRAALLALALGWGVAASARPEVPALSSRVVDQAGVFEPAERARLDESLGRFERERGPQIFVLTVLSLEGEPIETYSLRVAEKWRPGGRKEDNGVLVVVAINDRKARIEVGQGLEGDLPDVLAGRIIRETMAPYFKTQRYRDGLVAGLQEIAARLGGTLGAEAPAPQPREGASLRGHHLLFLFLLLFILLPRLLGRGHRRPGGFWTGMVLGSVLGGGRGRSGGGGFGGFGGGGGGGFSGGGASGDW